MKNFCKRDSICEIFFHQGESRKFFSRLRKVVSDSVRAVPTKFFCGRFILAENLLVSPNVRESLLPAEKLCQIRKTFYLNAAKSNGCQTIKSKSIIMHGSGCFDSAKSFAPAQKIFSSMPSEYSSSATCERLSLILILRDDFQAVAASKIRTAQRNHFRTYNLDSSEGFRVEVKL